MKKYKVTVTIEDESDPKMDKQAITDAIYEANRQLHDETYITNVEIEEI